MDYIIEPERKIPVKAEYDTVVAGGGIAGIAAAAAAARGGARVLLIEKQYMLGGLATAGLVTIFLPLCDGMGRQVTFGIAEELLRLSVRHGYEGKYPSAWLENGSYAEKAKQRFEVQYNPYIFAIEAEKLLKSAGVEILFGTSVCEACISGGKIRHIITENKSGRTAVALKNIIDCLGDADICRLAGENTVVFSQGNVPASWYYYVEDGENKLKMLGFSDIPDSQKTAEQLENSKSSLRFTGLEADELSNLTLYSHSVLLDDFLKKGKDTPKYSLSSIATTPQIRMTRRIDGKYTQDDTEMHKEYNDSVGLFSDWRKPGPVYELPFGALTGRKITNLLAAGRCISATDAMWDITRVIPVCALSGQAAGTAAAMTDNFDGIDINKLQDSLKLNGVILHESEILSNIKD